MISYLSFVHCELTIIRSSLKTKSTYCYLGCGKPSVTARPDSACHRIERRLADYLLETCQNAAAP